MACDPKALAENIAKEFCEGEFTSEKYQRFLITVESLLAEAMEGAYKDGEVNENERHGNVDYLKEIREKACEKAAQVVEESGPTPNPIDLAAAIRKLGKGGE